MKTTAGYSSTPLRVKLGLKESARIKLINHPINYFQLIDKPAHELNLLPDGSVLIDFVHIFTTDYQELKGLLPQVKQTVEKNGMIWISWPRKASRQSTDITQNRIRAAALNQGLIDVKVCAIDNFWSGLKLVFQFKPDQV